MAGFPLEGHVYLEAIQFGQCVRVMLIPHHGQFQYGTDLICQLLLAVAWLWHVFSVWVVGSCPFDIQIWKGCLLIG